MRKSVALIVTLGLVFLLSACGIYWDELIDVQHPPVRVVFKIEPDDAQILLNGRFIGEAYEFRTWDSALELLSKHNEIIIKREGYVEEVVDLFDYATARITVAIALKKIRDDAVAPAPAVPPAEPSAEPAEPPAYTATPAPPEEPAKEAVEEEVATVKTARIHLEVVPTESAIYLNGRFWGIAPEGGRIDNLRLEPGEYTLEVTKPGYAPAKKTIKVTGQAEVKVSIQLEKKTEEEPLVL